MKYILIFLTFFLIGCQKENKSLNKVYIEDVVKPDTIKEKIIKIEDLTFYKTDDNKIKYSFTEPKILLFVNNNNFSELQIKELKKIKDKFYIITNQKLINYFNISTFPTIIITKDNNHTKKYEGFIPKEMLNYEIKD